MGGERLMNALMLRRQAMMAGKAEPRRLYLYNRGDECSAVTGGWRNFGYNKGTDYYATKNTDNLAMGRSGTTNQSFAVTFSTTNAIDLSQYTRMVMEFETYKGVSTSNGNAWVYLPTTIANATSQSNAFGSDYSSRRLGVGAITTAELRTETANIPSSIQTAYVAVNLDMWNNPKITYINIYSIYLE